MTFVAQDDISGDYRELVEAVLGVRPAPEISAEEQAEADEPQEIEEVEEEVIEETGSLQAPEANDVRADCEKLKKAMKGLGNYCLFVLRKGISYLYLERVHIYAYFIFDLRKGTSYLCLFHIIHRPV